MIALPVAHPVTRRSHIPYVVGSLAAALILWCGRPPLVPAQSRTVPLQLVHRVEAPGAAPHGTEPLPVGTEAVVVPLEGRRARTIPNLALRTRDTLAARAQEQARSTLRADGATPAQHATTGTSGRIYYVLARTPTGTLYESYVNTGTVNAPAFVPGADAVQTGRMTIGPVPADAQSTMQAVFADPSVASRDAPDAEASGDAAMSSAPQARDTASAPTDTGPSAPASVEARTASTTGAPAPAASQRPVRRDDASSSALDGWWWLLSGIGGLLVGLGAGWALQYRTAQAAIDDRDYWRSRYREEQARAYRQATGIQLDRTPTDEGDDVRPEHHADEQDPDALRTANADLYAENEELKRRLREVKTHIQSMREGRGASSETGAS